MSPLDTSKLVPLDTSGLEEIDQGQPAEALDVSGLKPLDTSGLQEIPTAPEPAPAAAPEPVELPLPPQPEQAPMAAPAMESPDDMLNAEIAADPDVPSVAGSTVKAVPVGVIETAKMALAPYAFSRSQAQTATGLWRDTARNAQNITPEDFDAFMRDVMSSDAPTSLKSEIINAARDVRIGRMAPEQVPDWEASIEGNPVADAMGAMQEFSDETFPIPPEHREALPVQVAHGLGSTATFLASALVPGGQFILPVTAASMGAGEALERAAQEGATDEQQAMAGLMGVAPGLTDVAPIENLFRAVPMAPGVKGALIGIARKMAEQGLIEGTQEAIQQFLQNGISIIAYAEKEGGEIWDALKEGVGDSFTVAALVGLLFGGGAGGIQAATREEQQAAIDKGKSKAIKDGMDILAGKEPADEAAGAPEVAETQSSVSQPPEQAGSPLPEAPEAEQQPEEELDVSDLTTGTGERDAPVRAETSTDIDQAASQADPNPTEAQKEAGNYKKGHLTINGLDITIENQRGSERSGTDEDGNAWSVPMKAHYGYLKRTDGADGEQVDVYLGVDVAADTAYIVDQIDPKTGKFDEHKVILGATTQADAEWLYDVHFNDGSGPTRRGAVSELPLDDFKTWLKDGDNAKPYAYKAAVAPDQAETPPELDTSALDEVTEQATGEESPLDIPEFLQRGEGEQISKEAATVAVGAAKQRLPEGFLIFQDVADSGLLTLSGPTDSPFQRVVISENWQSETKDSLRDKLSAAVDAARQHVDQGAAAEEPTEAKPRADQGVADKANRLLPEGYRIEHDGKRWHLLDPKGEVVAGNAIKLTEARAEEWIAKARGTTDVATPPTEPTETAPPTEPETPTEPVDPGTDSTYTTGGRTYQTKAFQSDDAANAFMAQNDGWGVIGVDGETVHVARVEDKGQPVPPKEPEPEPEAAPDETTTPPAEEAKEPEKPAEEEKEKRKPKMQDVGETMDDQRKNQEKDFEDSRTGVWQKDIKKVLDKASKSSVWPINLPKSASVGAQSYAEAVRDKINSFTEVAGSMAGGGRGYYSRSFKEAIEHQIVERPTDDTERRKRLKELEEQASKYISVLKELKKATEGAQTVDQVREALQKALYTSETVTENDKESVKKITLTEVGDYLADNALRHSWEGKNSAYNRRPRSLVERLSQKFSDEDAAPTKKLLMKRPTLSGIKRAGLKDYRDGKDVDGQDLMDKFGFRAVEFGNWVSGPERQERVNHVYDSFMDLADILGIDPKMISLGGKLGLAIGARGRGRHGAHYDDKNKLINLTKTNGDGSVAHEWGHALDFITGGPGMQKFKRGLEKSYNREHIINQIDNFLRGSMYWSGSASASKTREGRIENAKRMIDRIVKGYDRDSLQLRDFKTEARALDGLKESDGYWSRPVELFARAFESYVFDKLENAPEVGTDTDEVKVKIGGKSVGAGRSPYLVSSWVQEGNVTVANYKGRPYPAQQDRKDFAAMFDDLLQNIEWTDEGPKLKEGYKPFIEKQFEETKEFLEGFDLQARLEAMIVGDPSPLDGNWWYSYRQESGRGPGNQPQGHVGYNDTLFERGRFPAAVAYDRPLTVDEIDQYGLRSIEVKETQKDDGYFVYLTGADDTGDVGPSGGETLGPAQAADGGASAPEQGAQGGLDDGGAERDGNDGSTGPERDRSQSGPMGGKTGLSVGADGTGEAGSGQRSDAVRAAGTNYVITPKDALGEGGLMTKFDDNLRAIQTLKQIEAEDRLASADEQRILVKYVGWGGMPQAFDLSKADPDQKGGWAPRISQLKDALDENEYTSARASTTDAFYTPQVVIESMWEGVRRLGFTGGRVLEPAMGTGHFFGMMPMDLSGPSNLVGIEIDNVSARIAKQLYQNAAVTAKPYEDTALPEKYFDLVISNVPFGNHKPHDRKYNRGRDLIHDYYFRKSLALTRPGGVVAFITSKGTLDKNDTTIRSELAKTADFLGAIRLPGKTFKKNANTDVVTDIIFLRKKVEGETFDGGKDWADLAPIEVQSSEAGRKASVEINEYFAQNTDMILGELSFEHGYTNGRWRDELMVNGDPDSLSEPLAKAIENLPKDVIPKADMAAEAEHLAAAIPAEGVAEDGGYHVRDGKLFIREGELDQPVDPSIVKNHGETIKELLGLRDITRRVVKLQLEGAPDAETDAARKELNKSYDAIVKKHGFLTPLLHKAKFSEDPDAPRLYALENWNEESGKAEKADIFVKNTVSRHVATDFAETASDALTVSLNERGRVDLNFMAKLTGTPIKSLKDELSGVIFDDPESGWVTADAYLSGNVRHKLEVARSVADSNPDYRQNVKALEKAQPEDLKPSQITARLGASWVPSDQVELFASEIMGVPKFFFSIRFSPELGQWIVDYGDKNDSATSRRQRKQSIDGRTEGKQTWGTPRVPFSDLFQHALNGTFPTVNDKIDKKTVVNLKETEAARDKLRALKQKFAEWMWEDPERAKEMAAVYNREQNNIRLRIFDGAHLTFPGIASHITLKQHQKNAVWRILQTGNTYLGHEVGTGKTFTMIAAAMEAKRLGLKRKPMISVLKSTMEGFTAEAQRLYPGARILSIDITDKPGPRKRQMARIATNDWDLVIVTHDSFKRIPISPEAEKAGHEEELEMVEMVLREAHEQSGKNSSLVKRLETSKKNLQSKLKDLAAKAAKDTGMTFEELGVDFLQIDEGQEFKNLQFHTKLAREVRGLNPAGSGKSFDLYMKSKHLNNTGGWLVLASGTPLSNSVGELFTVSRYLQPDVLKERKIQHFDTWANNFGEVDQVTEYLPEGGGYRMVGKFAKFVNVPELMQMVYSVMDPVKAADTDIKRPPIRTGGPQAVLVPQNEMVAELQSSLGERAVKIRRDPFGSQPDNMLVVTMEGRKGAIDMRLVDPDAKDDPDTKINYAVDRVAKIHKQTKSFKGTQLIFADLGTPGKAGQFSTYGEIKRKLIEKGIPAKEIAFIHDAKNDTQRKKLFQKVRQGTVRVMIGSTQKAGTGVNVQDLVVAMHHMDVWWNIASYLQRNGRGHRQGNRVHSEHGWELEIFNYATEGTVDAFMWDKVQYKAKLFDQFLSGDMNQREIEDISDDAVSAAQMVAITSGDPIIHEKVELEHRVQQLSALRGAYSDRQRELSWEVNQAPSRIEGYQSAIDHHKADLAAAGGLEKISHGGKDYKLSEKKEVEEVEKLFKQFLAEGKKIAELDKITTDKEKADQKRWEDGVAFGTIEGPNGKFTVTAYTGFGVNIELIGPNKGYKGRFKLLASMAEGLPEQITQNINVNENTLAEIKTDLPKKEAALKEPFEHAEEYETKSKRLAEINDILVKRETEKGGGAAEESESPDQPVVYAADAWRLVMGKYDTLEVEGLEDFSIIGFEDPKAGEYVIHDRGSGSRITAGEGKDGALKNLQGVIDHWGLDDVRDRLSSAPRIDESRVMAARETQGKQGVRFSLGRRMGPSDYNRLMEGQRAKEELTAAVKDPKTGKIYTGQDHYSAILSAPGLVKRRLRKISTSGDQSNLGFLDSRGRFIGRDEAERRTGSRYSPEPKFALGQAENLATASPEVVQKVLELAKRIAPRANVRLVDRYFASGIPTLMLSGAPDMSTIEVAGSYSPDENLITVSLGLDAPGRTIRHEAIHALREMGLFTEREWSLLEEQSQLKWMDRYNIPEGETQNDKRIAVEEGVAYAYSDYRGGTKHGTAVDRLFQRISRFFRRLANAMRGMGYQTAEDVMERVERGAVGERRRRRKPGGRKLFSTEGRADKDGRTQRFTQDTERVWQRQLIRALSDTTTTEDIRVARALPVLKELGITDGPVTLGAKLARAIRRDHRDIPVPVWGRLPELLADPLYIHPYKDRTVSVVLDATTKAGEPIVVGMRGGEIRTITPQHNNKRIKGVERMLRRVGTAISETANRIYVRDSAAFDEVKRANGGDLQTGRGTSIKNRADIKTNQGRIFYSTGAQPAPPSQQPNDTEFSDPEVEARFQKAAKGLADGDTLRGRVREWWEAVKIGFTRHYTAIPNTAQFAKALEALRQLEAAPEAAKEESVRLLEKVTKGFTADELMLFTRKVLLEDLAYEAEQEHAMPFGFTPEGIETDKPRIDAAFARNEKLVRAWNERQRIMGDLKARLIKAGILNAETAKNPGYFRHQVLQYARVWQFTQSAGQKLKKPKPGYAKHREGSLEDINANYLEAEFEYLHRAMIDLKASESIEKIKNDYDKHAEAAKAAKEHNEDEVQKILDRDLRENGYADEKGRMTSPLNEQWKVWKQRVAMGFGQVQKAIEDGLVDVPSRLQDAAEAMRNRGAGSTHPDTFKLLAWLADNDGAGATGAKMVMKNVTARKRWIKNTLGKDFRTYRDMVPEGHTLWQPDRGNLFFTAKTIPERIIDALLAKIEKDGDVPGLTKEELTEGLSHVRSVIVLGGPKYEMVIPDELAETLDNMRPDLKDSPFERFAAMPQMYWKRWVLINPRRVVKYNINNLSGDIDAIIAGNPGALKKMPQAIRELWTVMQDGEMTDRYREAIERGVFNSGLSIQEIPDINLLRPFERIIKPARVTKTPGRWATYQVLDIWHLLKEYTQFRENWLRYAAYLDYVDRLEGGQTMREIGYGASLPEMVDAIEDPKDRAGLLARELVGDYGNISHYGAFLRRYVIPFWSWNEINLKRYYRLLKNGWMQGAGSGTRVTAVAGGAAVRGGAKLTAKLYLRMLIVYAAVTAYNNIFWGDEEDELDIEERIRLHIILGRDDDGNINLLRFQGALSDAFSWLGLENAVAVMTEIDSGRATWFDVAKEVAKAPINKIASGISPVIKTPFELASGMTFWPDLFNPRPVKDRGREALRLFSLEHEYDWLTGKPSRGYGSSLTSAVISKRNVAENSYFNIREQARKYLEREKGTSGMSTYTSPRSEAIYLWKKAKRLGDKDAEKKYFQQMKDFGVTPKTLRQSIKRAHPLGSIAKKERRKFINSLNPKEKEQLKLAIKWYQQTYRGTGYGTADEESE